MDTKLSNKRLAINPVFVPLRISDNAIEFRVGPFIGSKHTIRDSEGEGIVGDLFNYFNGDMPVSHIVNEFDDDYAEEIQQIIRKLHKNKVLIDVSNKNREDLWFYSIIDNTISEDQIERLQGKTVGVISRGKMGEMVASDLDRVGVKDIYLKQLRTDDEQNSAQGGSIISAKMPIPELVSTTDYIVYTDESPGMNIIKKINETAIETKTPITVGQLLGGEAILGPTVIPNETPCFQCLLSRWEIHQTNQMSYQEYINSSLENHEFRLAPHARMLAGLVSKEAMIQLLTGHGYVVGRTLDINLLLMDFSTNEVMKMPRCPVCGVQHEDQQELINSDLRDYSND